MNFGESFRKSRKSAQIYLREVAEATKFSIPYLADVERGFRLPPKKKTIIKMLRSIGITKKSSDYNIFIECAKNEIIDHSLKKFLS